MKTKFSEVQIINILKTAESGRPIREICREYGIAESTYFKWKTKYSGMQVSDIKKLKEIEEENRRLKRMYADLALENTALKDLIAKKF